MTGRESDIRRGCSDLQRSVEILKPSVRQGPAPAPGVANALEQSPSGEKGPKNGVIGAIDDSSYIVLYA